MDAYSENTSSQPQLYQKWDLHILTNTSLRNSLKVDNKEG